MSFRPVDLPLDPPRVFQAKHQHPTSSLFTACLAAALILQCGRSLHHGFRLAISWLGRRPSLARRDSRFEAAIRLAPEGAFRLALEAPTARIPRRLRMCRLRRRRETERDHCRLRMCRLVDRRLGLALHRRSMCPCVPRDDKHCPHHHLKSGS